RWHRRELVGGVVLGLLCLKPNWLFAAGAVSLALGRWRMLGGMGLGAGAVAAGTALWMGIAPFADYLGVFRQVADLHDMPGYYLAVKYNGLAVFRKWLGPGVAADVLGWLSCLLLVVATWRVTRRCGQGPSATLRAGACCVTACLWVNPHLNYYDLLLMAPCTALIFWDWSTLSRPGRWVAVAVAVFVYIALPLDHSWAWGRVLPLPSFSILAVWGWFAYRLVGRPLQAGKHQTVRPSIVAPATELIAAGVGA
ncbi:MAG: glycosyltransferase 87 family protein, partial [Phycisphaerae bacterium]